MEKIPWMLYRREDRIREPERSGNEFRSELDYLRGLYPVSAKKSQILAEEACDLLEYPESPMYDEYPDRLSLLRKSQEVWKQAQKRENFGENSPDWEQIRDLTGVLLLQEMLVRRKKKRRR